MVGEGDIEFLFHQQEVTIKYKHVPDFRKTYFRFPSLSESLKSNYLTGIRSKALTYYASIQKA